VKRFSPLNIHIVDDFSIISAIRIKQMVEQDFIVSQKLKITTPYIPYRKQKYMEAINLIDQEKNPILHRYISINSTK
jgi:hypothetical protein